MTLYIGLIGKIGCGKSEFSKYLVKNQKAEIFRFSKILEDVLTRLSVPVTRTNLQNLGMGLRDYINKDVIITAAKNDLKNLKAEVVVIDGIRYPNEVALLRSFPENLFVYVDAPAELRYGRASARGTRGEATLSFEDFMKSEKKKTEAGIEKLAKKADVVIKNTGTLEDLHKNIERTLSAFREGARSK